MRAFALLLLAAACTPDFDAPSDVKDLRVLAVQAEPPEVRFDPDGGPTPPLTVRVLAVDPSADAGPQAMHLELCGPTDSRRCDEGPVHDAGTVPLAFTVPPISDFADFLASDDLAGFGGIRVQLSFSLPAADGGEVHGDKVVIYNRTDAPCPPNHNPAIGEVRLTIAGVDAGALAPGGALSTGTEYGVRPVLDGGEEELCALDLRGNLVRQPEQAHWAFFSDPGGSFDGDTADEPLDGGAPPDGLTRFTPHGDGGTIWVVVRDGRGGESWVTLPWIARADGGVSPSRPSSDRGRPGRR